MSGGADGISDDGETLARAFDVIRIVVTNSIRSEMDRSHIISHRFSKVDVDPMTRPIRNTPDFFISSCHVPAHLDNNPRIVTRTEYRARLSMLERFDKSCSAPVFFNAVFHLPTCNKT